MQNKTDRDIFCQRRKAFQKKMEANSIAIFFSASLQLRNNDVHYPFRQDSDFYYLTGFSEEDSILVLFPDNEEIYLRPYDPEKEIWDGPRLGLENVFLELGISKGKDITFFYDNLENLLRGNKIFYYRFGLVTQRDNRILCCIRSLLEGRRHGVETPNCLISPSDILHEMRIIKSDWEIELLREISCITYEAHLCVIQESHAGMYEYELEAILEYEFRRKNARQAYPPIVAGGSNACILHYIKNHAKLKEDKLVLVDAGAEKSCMSTDVTRTFPVGSRFTSIQKDVYEIVLCAQEKAIEMCIPDKDLNNVHDAAVLILLEGLVSLGVLKGSSQSLFEEAKEIEEKGNKEAIQKIPYRRYYMHRTSHWLGMDVHDVGRYYNKNHKTSIHLPRKLEKGMVCTVEPGLYFSSQDETISEELRGIGIRIEDDICVKEKKALVLTATIPKKVEEIEDICRAK